MRRVQLDIFESCGVTLLGDQSHPCGVTFAFSERSGGISSGPYESLNLSDRVGDTETSVSHNRQRLLEAVGAASCAHRLVVPVLVHGKHICVIADTSARELARVRADVSRGADAVVCLAAELPVMLLAADCALVVLVCPGAFALVHCGWKGAYAHLLRDSAEKLCSVADISPAHVRAYIGPHIMCEDYEVSPDLLGAFRSEFGEGVCSPSYPNHLDLSYVLMSDLRDAGIAEDAIASSALSTAAHPLRFFSHRRDGIPTGRHGVIAVRASSTASYRQHDVLDGVGI